MPTSKSPKAKSIQKRSTLCLFAKCFQRRSADKIALVEQAYLLDVPKDNTTTFLNYINKDIEDTDNMHYDSNSKSYTSEVIKSFCVFGYCPQILEELNDGLNSYENGKL